MHTFAKRLAHMGFFAMVLGATGCCFNYTGTHLPINAIGTELHYRTNPSIQSSWIPTINAASSRWTQASGNNFRFISESMTFAVGGAEDGVNTIYFTSLGPSRQNVLAVTTTWVSPSACLISESDMGFNSDIQVWSPPNALTQAQAFDVETVAAHEFGHMLRLGHTFWPRSTLMASNIGPNQSKPLHPCDALGINCIYTLLRCRLCRSVLCPAMMAATADSAPTTQRFADNVLPTTDRGRQYRAAFALRTDEAVQLLITDNLISQKASEVLSTFAPYLDAYANATDLRFVVFSAPMYQQIADFVSIARASASPDLGTELEDFRSRLQGQVGLTFQEVIDRMLEVPPPPPPGGEPPPEPPPPDPGPEPILEMYLKLYDEVGEILAGDEPTAQRTQSFVEPRVSYLQDYLQGGQLAQTAYFTQTDYQEVSEILQAIRANASPTLQTKIDQALQYFNGRIGWTYKALLDEAFPP